jgi:hypothetical protein
MGSNGLKWAQGSGLRAHDSGLKAQIYGCAHTQPASASAKIKRSGLLAEREYYRGAAG